MQVADPMRLLPDNKSFQALLWLYFSPYLVYVALSNIPDTLISTDIVQLFKLLATSAVLLWFGKYYGFGPLKAVHAIIALLALPAALLSWVGPFYVLKAIGLNDVMAAADKGFFSALYFYLKLVNAVILVAIFEELFIRVLFTYALIPAPMNL